MANASGPAIEGIEPGTFIHQASGVQYRVFTENGSAWLSYSRAGDAEMQGRQQLDFFLGSGNHGRTYLYSIGGYWFETPIAWYARRRGYDMRPSYLNDKEMPFNLPVTAGCLRCHATGVQTEDPGTRNHYAGLPFLGGGIACEGCHGDTAAHVSTGGKAAVINPVKLDAERRDSVCIVCHLEGDTTVPHRGRELVNYKVGERIGDYASFFVLSGAGTTNRAVSQVEALNLSTCKRSSGDRMSCMSCHDPHGSPAPQDRVAFYRSRCTACHSDTKFTSQHFPNQPDCTQCHMPKSSPTDIPHEQWTDHRILRHPGTVVMESATPSESALIPVPGIAQHPTERDFALAYYDIVSHGDVSFATRARKLLEALTPDNEVLTAIGVLAQMANDRKQSTDAYSRAIALDPDDYTAAMNLGVLLARSGETARASELWRKTFARNQDITGLGMNLAAASCLLGDKTAAEDTLRIVLRYSPDHQSGRQELEAMQSGAQPCPPK
jgi:predicted CXXCH cytochrome family protein